MEEQFVIKHINGTSMTNRAGFEEHQRGVAARQAEGRYTLEEAALAISADGFARPSLMLDKLMQAVRDGDFPVFEPGNNEKYQTKTVREFYEEAYWNDLNNWLEANEKRILWRFPKPERAERNAAMLLLEPNQYKVSVSERPERHGISKERGCRRLILEQWPEIEMIYGQKADGRRVSGILCKRGLS